MRLDANKPLLFIGIPTRGMHSHYFSQALTGTIWPSNFSLTQAYIPYLEVGKARNILAEQAIELGAKYLAFMDEDVIGPANGMKTLVAHMANHPEWTFCSGLYATKSYPPEPLFYEEWGHGPSYDWKQGELKPVLFTGMGFCIIRVADLELLTPETYEDFDHLAGKTHKIREFFKTGNEAYDMGGGNIEKLGHTEDAWFFKQLAEKGLKSYVDTGVLCRHYDDKTYTFFDVPLKGKPDAWNNTPRTLNIGAGGTYDPYEVSVDMRPDPHITYQCDVRKLPDDWTEQFDTVHAEHVLEHFDFGQTEWMVTEWTRVVKPGGKLILVVPDLEEYAASILGVIQRRDGDASKPEDAIYGDGKSGFMNVQILGGIYGDQGHSYWRQDPYGGEHDGRWIKDSFENNHHRSGFTSRSLAGAMAAAGLDITQLRRQDYQIICEGTKPLGGNNAEESSSETGTGVISTVTYADSIIPNKPRYTDAATVQVFSEPVAPVGDGIDA
jgi:SAM-dependent methyltransferase